jgi:N-acetylmuramoyl-L-alanine amidase
MKAAFLIPFLLVPVAALASRAPTEPQVRNPFQQGPAAELKEFRVVIDPGHGGADLGTVVGYGRRKVAEKDVTLQLAREVARQLRARGIRAVLTRDRDREIALPSRTALANRLQADLFVSIHLNSTATPMVTDAHGAETYILNNASDASSRRLARLENSVLGGSRNDAGGQTEVALILKDLRLDGNLAESKRVACAVQSNMVKGAPSRDRGVKQALFHVLLGADMPSILVEAGFLTNPRDRALVLSPTGRRSIAHAIARGVDQYRSGSSGLGRCKVN